MSAWDVFANASLTFDVVSSYTTDSTTGNSIETTSTVTYSAYLKPAGASYKSQVGADVTSYLCEGRLLSPRTLDAAIVNGSVAQCTLNGVQGSFQLKLELAQQSTYRTHMHQILVGTFQAVGRGSTANV